jgi:hypothetical protein
LILLLCHRNGPRVSGLISVRNLNRYLISCCASVCEDKTGKALGITFPPSFLTTADEVTRCSVGTGPRSPRHAAVSARFSTAGIPSRAEWALCQGSSVLPVVIPSTAKPVCWLRRRSAPRPLRGIGSFGLIPSKHTRPMVVATTLSGGGKSGGAGLHAGDDGQHARRDPRRLPRFEPGPAATDQ